MKTILTRLGIFVAGVGVLALFAWGTRVALRPVSHGLASYYYNEAYNEQKAGKYEAAITDYDRAIALNPEYSEAYGNRGLVKVYQGRLEEAVADYDRAIKLNPRLYQAYFSRARAREWLRDLPGALADFNRCIELHPNLPFAFAGRSHVKDALGDREGSAADADRMMELKPDEYAFNTRGSVKKIRGDRNGARADFEQAIQINPRSAQSYAARGDVEYMDRQWEAARKDYRHFCELSQVDQDYPHLFIWLTRTRQGEKGEADKELAAYLGKRKPGKSWDDDWSPKVAKFLLGQMTEDELFAAAKATSSKRVAGRLCEAWYYAGAKKQLAGDNASAAQYFRKSIETGQMDFVEYGFAKAELEELGK